jgi:hypothetical protein
MARPAAGGPSRHHQIPADETLLSPGKVFAIPYAVTRLGLSVIDARIIQQLPARSPARHAFDRGLGLADCVAGRVMGNERIRCIGQDRIDQAGNYPHRPEVVGMSRRTHQRYATTRPARRRTSSTTEETNRA